MNQKLTKIVIAASLLYTVNSTNINAEPLPIGDVKEYKAPIRHIINFRTGDVYDLAPSFKHIGTIPSFGKYPPSKWKEIKTMDATYILFNIGFLEIYKIFESSVMRLGEIKRYYDRDGVIIQSSYSVFYINPTGRLVNLDYPEEEYILPNYPRYCSPSGLEERIHSEYLFFHAIKGNLEFIYYADPVTREIYPINGKEEFKPIYRFNPADILILLKMDKDRKDKYKPWRVISLP